MGKPSQYVTTNQLPRSTQPSHPSVGRFSECQRKNMPAWTCTTCNALASLWWSGSVSWCLAEG